MRSPRDVLIVDDEDDIAEVVKAVLENEGYSCRCASDGQEALEQIADAMPALVLLDMLMPVMNGWECAHALRDTYGRGLPIVVMTAAEHAEQRRADTDADDVLSKPFDIHDLLRVVSMYVTPGVEVRTN